MTTIIYVVLSMVTTLNSNSSEMPQSSPPSLVYSVHQNLTDANKVVDYQVEAMISGGEEDKAIVHAEQRIGRSYGYSYGEVVTNLKRWKIWVERAEVEEEEEHAS